MLVFFQLIDFLMLKVARVGLQVIESEDLAGKSEL